MKTKLLISMQSALVVFLLSRAVDSHAEETEKPPDLSVGIVKGPPASPGAAKLSLELRDLSSQFTTTRGGSPQTKYTSNQLHREFGITRGQKQPSVEVAIKMTGKVDTNALIAAGVHVWFTTADMVFARVPIAKLQQLTRVEAVKSIRNISAVETPPAPKSRGIARVNKTRGAPADEKLADKFDHQGFNGKGVAVGLIDTGIDWRHLDFIRPDGKTRILRLYDPFDNSWQESGGKVGSSPPYEKDGVPYGTVYTSDQINEALTGRGQVNSTDKHGHGTACAGTAAGNGRAAAPYQGVAPEADLIIVKRAADDGSGSVTASLGADWILSTAKGLGKACVISMSFGGHNNAHDGSDPQEEAIDSFFGAGKPGAVAVICAGNEGQDNLHAAGRFGSASQPDSYSASVELFVSEFTRLVAYFSAKDEWGLAVVGLDNLFISDDGKPVLANIYRVGDKLSGRALQAGSQYYGSIAVKWTGPEDIFLGGAAAPANFAEYFERYVDWENLENGKDKVVLLLPPGKYQVAGFGNGEKVVEGKFDLYVPASYEASFGRGVTATELINIPGNSSNAITVGSYVFRNSWQNFKGTTTTYNLPPGGISDYSSPGFRSDGLVKPEIAAPAEYAISTLAKDCEMGQDGDELNAIQVTRDGQHIAWRGTSAAAPYVAGVVALMLQKNPNLDSDQIKTILIDTARKDEFTGAVPNREWGYGKIDPAAALKMTPSPKAGVDSKDNNAVKK